MFIFDDDIDVYNPTEILWALATRVQPHRQVSLITDLMRGPLIDPSMDEGIRTSAMIVDATRPLDRPFSPRVQVSRTRRSQRIRPRRTTCPARC